MKEAMEELKKAYDPEQTEERIYELWLQSQAFQPKVDKNQPPFTIVIPPPNVTGSLHMGHALNNTIQDILIRKARMEGRPALWVPGTDHAGIATQNVVEKELAREGKTRHDLGREKFVERVWQWKEKYGGIILEQLKKLGCSLDWSRTRFTMDDDYSKAVQAAFEHYYKKGWIYQGERVVNWCPRCQTALSDIEVEYKPQKAKLYYFKYDKNFPIIIATTRPETKLGDTAVAVNPKDERFQKFIGQSFEVNFAGKSLKIKIIDDPAIDPKFGTGALGVTPAHSITDFEIAQKNNLPIIKIIDDKGKMTKEAGPDFEGLKTKQAAEKILDWLKTEKLLEREQEIDHNLSLCYRCGTALEPIPSMQWFLKMAELAKPAIKVVEQGKIKFVPERFEKVYLDWLKNIRDWCISRQIWWGHRLPVFIKQEKCKNQNPKCKIKESIYVGDNPPPGYKQVDDVLDTWFSSALWPLAVFNWPQKTKDLAYFYPTTILTTAREILFLWVSRMVFSGLEFMKDIPFKKVLVHPVILTKEGKRMSKSLGTGVNPLNLIEKYGADAVRFGLIWQMTGLQDIRFSEDAILNGQKFANKIWNSARFILLNSKSKMQNAKSQSKIKSLTKADKKILDSLSSLIISINSDFDQFRFGQGLQNLYHFYWHEFCDIYLEQSKKQLADPKLKESTETILIKILTLSLKLLHPFMPFLTEEIWQQLWKEKLVEEEMLILAKWPENILK